MKRLFLLLLCGILASNVYGEITTSVRLIAVSVPHDSIMVNNGHNLISDITSITTDDIIYVEIWTSTTEPKRYNSQGLTTAVVDIVYPKDELIAMSEVLSPQWKLLQYDNSINAALGIVDNVGGNNMTGLGIYPIWEKVSTIKFKVINGNNPVKVCSQFSGNHLTYAIKGYGVLPNNRIDFGCIQIGCILDSDCNDGDACTIDACKDGVCLHTNSTCTNPDPCLVGVCNTITECSFSSKICNDDLFCNGVENCINGECTIGDTPCGTGVCNEETDSCLVSGNPLLHITIVYTCMIGSDGKPTACWLDSNNNSSESLSGLLGQ